MIFLDRFQTCSTSRVAPTLPRYRWHFVHQVVARPAMRPPFRGNPQPWQGSPVRP